MDRYVVILLFVVVFRRVRAPPPIRVTIDCGSKERDSLGTPGLDGRFTVNSFCNLIHNSIPKAIHDGRVIFLEDQDGFGNSHVPISMPPPEGFVPKLELPKFRVPKLKIPTMKVPTLKLHSDNLKAPRLGSAMKIPTFRYEEEDSSAERMEKFKKGVRKMLHVVKVLGQIDQYLSDRTRIIVDKLSKAFAE
ncbi:uncharacterized protein LOC128679218 isoform X2 [Plodia interpunctella]|uniref:uncharacterized protein LOC128679218 isoform X2 n=1 Tax=Plodia interpunctella TaxID=58824 RepID=UPI0023686B0B|nr:uncharacterized protein LOC128679218 isoform X2 [Plodia interpunctella]